MSALAPIPIAPFVARTFCGKSDRRTDILDPALITRILQPGEQSFVVSVVRLGPYSFECTKHHDFPSRGACILHDLDQAAGMAFIACHFRFPFDRTSHALPSASLLGSINSSCVMSAEGLE